MSLLHFPNSSLDSGHSRCNNTDGSRIGLALISTRVFLLFPVSLLILCHGAQRRRRRSFTAMSHFDVFTFHHCVLELVWILGTVLQFLGSSMDLEVMSMAGTYLSTCIFPGEPLFHVLTCLDRYLAVVHPVLYVSLRSSRGVSVRNVAVFGVWLLCFLFSCAANNLRSVIYIRLFSGFLTCSVLIMLFCGVSVLCALIGPGPGKKAGNKKLVDQSILRAFVTVAAITGVLCLWFFAFLVSSSLTSSALVAQSVSCVLEVSVLWFSLPCSLILPLLYLLKTGTLQCGHGGEGQEMDTEIN
ncbi:uncharacterized protein LOC106949940 [Poecilia latipinna]|uniref:uncharacterized protein LOC106949940 n=1 Tax=Poecilia latipinna TaxID=48699 RepID=UPI00072EE394|nr:PREDICTED: uncharacterized protein LOC106949940 [Poecilia latipinna]